ncbi:cytochrome c biogenesis CcdA family protein [Tistlia consotensis]|nr:cytochrome c biogenesis protein CcdA [Tistlia consotensis]
MDVTYAGAALAGLLSFLSPCVLPLVPPYLAFLGGVSAHEIEGRAGAGGEAVRPKPFGRTFWMALAFVLGFATVFVALGAGASAISGLVTRYIDVLVPIAGVVVLVLGLHFLGLFRILLLFREARFHVQSRPVGLAGAYVIGLAFAFGWTPCVGPVLASILLVAGSGDSVFYGASLLATYAAGIGIPFLLAALAIGSFTRFLAHFRRYLGWVEKALGAILVATGVLFITGGIADVSYWLLETFPVLGRIG